MKIENYSIVFPAHWSILRERLTVICFIVSVFLVAALVMLRISAWAGPEMLLQAGNQGMPVIYTFTENPSPPWVGGQWTNSEYMLLAGIGSPQTLVHPTMEHSAGTATLEAKMLCSSSCTDTALTVNGTTVTGFGINEWQTASVSITATAGFSVSWTGATDHHMTIRRITVPKP